MRNEEGVQGQKFNLLAKRAKVGYYSPVWVVCTMGYSFTICFLSCGGGPQTHNFLCPTAEADGVLPSQHPNANTGKSRDCDSGRTVPQQGGWLLYNYGIL